VTSRAMESVMTDISATGADPYRDAWDDHTKALAEIRQQWFASGWAKTPEERDQAMFHVMGIEHTGFNVFVAPRQDYPFFSKTHAFHHPISFTWGLCCPDFHYQFAFLDGARTYRIKGKRGTKRWSEIHVQNEFWGDPKFRQVTILDLDNVEMDADGNFEIIVSPDRHDGNWIQTQRDENQLLFVMRDAMYDWSNDVPAQVHVELAEGRKQPLKRISDRDLPTRIGKLTNFLRASATHWIGRNDEIVRDVGVNTFWMGKEQNLGGIQHAVYHFMVFDIAADEALVIEADVPAQSKFWAVQLANLCYDTVDYLNNQSSLNGFQTKVDPDGKARFVLTRDDPGVANWLDTVGNLRGVAAWRWVYCDKVTVPSVTKVKVAELDRRLHPQTARVSPEERQAIVTARGEGVRRMYGI